MILYQFLLGLALPILLLQAALSGGRRALRERLGICALPQPGPRLWLHGASNGEVTSARGLLSGLIAARPGLQVVITTNSLTGRDLVESWNMPGVTGALAPADSGGAAGRFLDRFQPHCLVILENELWPARLAAAHRRGVQILLIGARLSARSAGRWARWPGLIGAALGQIDWLSPQDDASGARFVALGLPPGALGPTVSLKAQTEAISLPLPFAPPCARAGCLLAASTHEGEDAAILSAFAKARHDGGPGFLILAPRHPGRGDEVAALIKAAGLPFARRSKGEVPAADMAVFLADTLGEMPLWYAMAGICVIGGTFAARGGHTPFEPTSYGCALIHGPSVSNFAPQFAALDQGGGAIRLADLQGLTAALQGLTGEQQAALVTAAVTSLAPFAIGSEVIAARLLSALPVAGPSSG